MNQNEYLDAKKSEYLNPKPDRIADQKVIDLMSDFVISRLDGERILELGIGDMVWTPKLIERFAAVVTVDGSAELLAAAGEKLRSRHAFDRWTPICSLFEEYSPEKLFDMVIATNVLEHVDDPSLILNLAYHKWLNDTGKLVVVVPHALSLHRRLAVKMGLALYPWELGDTDRRMGHKRCFTYCEMEKLIAEAGFKVKEKEGMFTKLLPNSILSHCSDEQLSGMFELGRELPIEYSAIIYFLAKKDEGNELSLAKNII